MRRIKCTVKFLSSFVVLSVIGYSLISSSFTPSIKTHLTCCKNTSNNVIIKTARDAFYQKHIVNDEETQGGNIHSHIKRNKEGASLEEDMKRCSLAMGMSRKELNMLPRVVKKVQLFLDTLQSIWPQKFSQSFKNPCWYPNFTITPSNEQTIRAIMHVTNKQLLQKAEILSLINNITMESNTDSNHLLCLPYFFLAGFPKSGTTLLHATLSKHPQILPPNTKEPQWWTRIPLADMNHDYLKLVAMRYPLYFTSAATALDNNFKQGITYDGSQSFLWRSNFLSEINHIDYCATPAIVSRILPNAKFIVLMRNPVTREYSNFYYLCDQDHTAGVKRISKDPTTQFHHVASTIINTFNRCMEIGDHSLPWCVGEIQSYREGCGYIGKRLAIGLYYFNLYKWFQFYPCKNFLLLRTEDIHKEPHRMMTRITEFLGIDQVSKEDAEQWLSEEHNVQHAYPVKYRMIPETKRLLEDFYKPYNELLAKLIDDERFLWI